MGSSLPAWVRMLPGMDVSGLSIPQHPALEQRRMLPWVTLHMSFDFSVFVTPPTGWTRFAQGTALLKTVAGSPPYFEDGLSVQLQGMVCIQPSDVNSFRVGQSCREPPHVNG